MLAAITAAFLVYRRRRLNRQPVEADDWLKEGDISPAGGDAEVGGVGYCAMPEPAPAQQPPLNGAPTAPGAPFVVPGDELATLPTMQEPPGDDALGTYPTRPGGPCPASLASLVAGLPANGTPPTSGSTAGPQVSSLRRLQEVAAWGACHANITPVDMP